MPVRAPRIVSLVPSGTDMLAELGLGDSVVGVSHQCDHAVAAGRPVVTSSTIPFAGPCAGPTADLSGSTSGAVAASPGEVDRAVSRAVQAGQPLYRTDMDLLRQLAPDVVVAQDVCDVCAVGPDQVLHALPRGAELVTLEATSMSGLEDDLVRLGKATGTEDQAAAAMDRVRRGMEAVADQVAGRPRRPVIVLEWGDPPFLGGHWVPELVELAGGRHLLSSAGQASRRASWAEVVAAGADVMVFAPCGYPLAAAEAEARGLQPRLVGQDKELWVTDATNLFSRCTPTAVLAAIGVLAGILHPAAAPPPPTWLAVPI